jgi:hypothetical protein
MDTGGQGLGQVVHQAGHGPLGVTVPCAPRTGRVHRTGQQSGHGSGADDRGAGAQLGVRRRDRVHNPVQVDLDDIEPHPGGRLPVGHDDPGVGHHDVQVPELGHPCLDCGDQLGLVPDVRHRCHDPAVESLDLTDRLVQVRLGGHCVRYRLDLVAQVDGDDVGPFLGQTYGVAPTLPAGSACHQRNLAFHSSWHDDLLTYATDRTGRWRTISGDRPGRPPKGRQVGPVSVTSASHPAVVDTGVGSPRTERIRRRSVPAA